MWTGSWSSRLGGGRRGLTMGPFSPCRASPATGTTRISLGRVTGTRATWSTRAVAGAYLYAPTVNCANTQSYSEVKWGDICEIVLAMQWVDRLSRVVGRVDCLQLVQHTLVWEGARRAPAVEKMVRITYNLSTMLDSFVYCGFSGVG